MVANINSVSYIGLVCYPVEIEVDIQSGLPCLNIIGLADTQIKESKERVRSSIINSGYQFPSRRITINLAPANIKKEGTHFDLAIALGILKGSRQIDFNEKDYVILGELSLKGDVRKVSGVFAMLMQVKHKIKKVILPKENINEALALSDNNFKIYPVENLLEAVQAVAGEKLPYIGNRKISCSNIMPGNYEVDFSEVKGQLFAKRALEVAVSGMHNLILIGPPGVGKTMLAQRIPTILPYMHWEEIIELTKIYSIVNLLPPDNPIMTNRPFRMPHHTCSHIALVGGGSRIQPGEITLAHQGVLFLDELPEFSRQALESLRQPLENGFIHISRAAQHVYFPARFLFVGAMNPCPCGYYGSRRKNCHCSSYQIHKYRHKISGPLLDRVDIHIELQDVKVEDIFNKEQKGTETSATIRERVEKARKVQQNRFSEEKIFFNSQMNNRLVNKYCKLKPQAKQLLKQVIQQLNLSMRAYTKVIKVAQTIADLAGQEIINEEHIAEAVQYRRLDRVLWN